MPTRKEEEQIQHHLDLIIRYVRGVMSPGINRISELTTHILLSNSENAEELSNIKDYGLSAILYIGQKPKEPNLIKNYKKKKVEYIHLIFPDINESPDKKPQNLIPHLNQAYNIIHKYVSDEKKILVHCHSGLSLSVAIVLYYFLNRYYLTNFKSSKEKTKDLIDYRVSFLPGVVKFLKEVRPCIDPHPAYIYQILLVENQMKKYFENILLEEAKEKRKNQSQLKKHKQEEKEKKKNIKNKENEENEIKELESEESEDENIFPDEIDNEKEIDLYLNDIENKKQLLKVRFQDEQNQNNKNNKNNKKQIIKSTKKRDKLEDLQEIERSDLDEEPEETKIENNEESSEESDLEEDE